MENNEKFKINELNYEEMLEELNNTSPLDMGNKLIEYELYDQKSSIEILNNIYKDLDSSENIKSSLLTPILLNVGDGLIKHPKLKGTFRKTNITATKLVQEVNSFSYELDKKVLITDDMLMRQGEKEYYSKFHRNKFYDKKARTQTEKEKNVDRKQSTEIKDYITDEKLDLTKDSASQKGIKSADMDHVNPINHLRKKYKNNPYLYRDDIEKFVGLPENESYINSSLNRAKGDKTWNEYITTAKKDKNGNILNSNGNIIMTKKEQIKAIELEEKSSKAINHKKNKIMAKNMGLVALGDVIIMILKPIWFELKDIFDNGITYGVETDEKVEAFILRIKRVFKYIRENIVNTLGDSLKDIVENLVSVIMSTIINLFTSIMKKIFQIILQGFQALRESFKILQKKDISSTEKADAITKIIISIIVPLLTFSFEEVLSKIPYIGDVATIIISGILTTLFIWVFDQIDIFSVKKEKRIARIKEIFQLRIDNIEKNKDTFGKNSLEVLAKQKLQFKKMIENSEVRDLTGTISQFTNFMKIDLKFEDYDEFLDVLKKGETIKI